MSGYDEDMLKRALRAYYGVEAHRFDSGEIEAMAKALDAAGLAEAQADTERARGIAVALEQENARQAEALAWYRMNSVGHPLEGDLRMMTEPAVGASVIDGQGKEWQRVLDAGWVSDGGDLRCNWGDLLRTCYPLREVTK